MTNLQADLPARGFLNRETLLFGAPVLLGGVVALAVLGLGVLPVVQEVARDQQKVDDLNQQKSTLPLIRNQLIAQQAREAEALGLRGKLLTMIAGSGTISTFLAQLSAEGLRTGVQLDAYEPVVAVAPAAAPAAKPAPPPATGAKGAPPAAAQDPLLVPGLQKTSLLLGARGSYPQLLAFLRRLESLGLLVVQKDLALTQEEAKPSASAPEGSKAPPVQSIPRSVLKLNVGLYSQASE
jgi:type IV pilus assembly protein PilO